MIFGGGLKYIRKRIFMFNYKITFFCNLNLHVSSKPFSTSSKECAAALFNVLLGGIPFILLLFFLGLTCL